MKVILIARSTLFKVKGGDTYQVQETARQIAQLGVSVSIQLAGQAIDYHQFDLLHFFNLTRPADILRHIQKTTKPFVVSPIWIDYSLYDKYQRKGLSGMLFKRLSPGKIEYSKALARWLLGNDTITLSYIRKGQKQSISDILGRASFLLPNSDMEYRELRQHYSLLPLSETIPNGIDTGLFVDKNNSSKDQKLVLCVGRIEGIKNQLTLIHALNNTPFRLLLIGAPAPNQAGYYKACREAAASNITFIDHLPQTELVHYYQQAGVHVLPSWFETCGLSSLEAAAMGCNIVITDKGYTREYYEDYAFYCDPSSPASIRQAIEKAATAPYPKKLRNKVLTNYTWQKAAEKTLKAYRQVLQQI